MCHNKLLIVQKGEVSCPLGILATSADIAIVIILEGMGKNYEIISVKTINCVRSVCVCLNVYVCV